MTVTSKREGLEKKLVLLERDGAAGGSILEIIKGLETKK